MASQKSSRKERDQHLFVRKKGMEKNRQKQQGKNNGKKKEKNETCKDGVFSLGNPCLKGLNLIFSWGKALIKLDQKIKGKGKGKGKETSANRKQARRKGKRERKSIPQQSQAGWLGWNCLRTGILFGCCPASGLPCSASGLRLEKGFKDRFNERIKKRKKGKKKKCLRDQSS
jgi:hypothetical protein